MCRLTTEEDVAKSLRKMALNEVEKAFEKDEKEAQKDQQQDETEENAKKNEKIWSLFRILIYKHNFAS